MRQDQDPGVERVLDATALSVRVFNGDIVIVETCIFRTVEDFELMFLINILIGDETGIEGCWRTL